MKRLDVIATSGRAGRHSPTVFVGPRVALHALAWSLTLGTGCTGLLAGESSEHPPTVALNPAAAIAAPAPLFPPEIAALRSEIAAETDPLAREQKMLLANLVSKDEPITPAAVGALAETLDTARAGCSIPGRRPCLCWSVRAGRST